MERQRLLRISVVDESVLSPRIADDETGGDWVWQPPRHRRTDGSRSPTPLHELQSPVVFPNGRASAIAANGGSGSRTQSPASSARHTGMHQRNSSSPRSRGAAVMEKIMNPPLDRETPSAVDNTASSPHTHCHERPVSSHIKASAFDDDYHSVYVAQYPGGLRGLFVLFQSPLLLIAVGLFSAFVGLFVDFWLAQIAEYRNQLTDMGFRYFVLSALVAAGFATALTHLICPQSAGSGLPHMRVAISGVDMSEYLTMRCIVIKIVGLVAVFFAGLSVGKEGPFIMISCAFASVLMHLPLFQRINSDDNKRLEMLACACSAGVAATFGSPFGGVLFGVEVTSHFYMVRTLPRSFFAAIVGALFINFVTSNTRYGLFGSSNMGISTTLGDLHDFSGRDLALFIAMGVVCGLGGALFNFSISLLVRYRDKFFTNDVETQTRSCSPVASSTLIQRWRRALRRFLLSPLGKRLLLVLSVTLLACVTEFYGDSAWFIRHGSPHRILGALFSKDKTPFTDPSKETKAQAEDDDSILLSRSLVTYLPLKFVLTLLSVVLPVPAGLFTPTFVIGGIFGRLVGEAINAFDLLDTQYEPFEFAIIGAGAFSSGVTHAISTAVIIMEISHSDGLNLPVSIAILASYFTAKRFTENVYDVLISTSNLPLLKKLPKAAYDIPLWEVMRDVQDMNYLTADSTYRDALHVLRRSREPMFPIVDDCDNLFLLATVTRRRLESAVVYCQQKMRDHARHMELSAITAARTPLRSYPRDRVYGAIDDTDATAVTNGIGVPWSATIELLDWPIHFAFRRGGKVMEWGTNELCTRTKLTVLINPSPFQLMEMTPMKRVDLLFRMLKLNNAYITRSGRLVGMITRDRLMTFLGKTKKFRVPGLCSTMAGCCWGVVQTGRSRHGRYARVKRDEENTHADHTTA